MKEQIVKTYEILISTPSDVYRFVEAVKNAISEYNNNYGLSKGVLFTQKNWREHSIPEYGASPQALLNKQIVYDAQIVIALFGAKFGEPTEKYESGTLEEIETVHNNGGEVLTYFGKGKICDVSKIDPEQLKKVQEYKKKYHGIYGEFSSAKKLKDKLLIALIILADKLKKKDEKDLRLYSFLDNELSEDLQFNNYTFIKSSFMLGLEQQIKGKISNIFKIALPVKENIPIKLSEESMKKLSGIVTPIVTALDGLYTREDIKFESTFFSNIERFAKKHSIEIPDNFYDIGGAYYSKRNIVMGYSCEVCGEEQEKEKAQQLLELEGLLEKYYNHYKFFEPFENATYLSLVLKNESNIYADDITIKLYFDKDAFFSFDKKLLVFDTELGESLQDFLDVFEIKDNVDIEDMAYGSPIYPTYTPTILPMGGGVSGPDLSYYQNYLQAKAKELYPYIANVQKDKVVLKFDIPQGLKQFSAKFLCAQLIFTKTINEIYYVITSKSFGHEMKGVLRLREDREDNAE